MELKINLFTGEEIGKQEKAAQRVKDATNKKKAKMYEPTWDEVWISGYPTSTGRHKAGIFQTKITPKDKERLIEVKSAIEQGELTKGVDSLKNFSKSHALNLYKLLQEKRRDSIVQDYIKNLPDNYHTVTNEKEFNKVEQLLELAFEKDSVVGLDTETTGVQWIDRTVGISLSFIMDDIAVDEHFYIPYAHITDVTQLSRGWVCKKLKKHLERKGLKLALHNSKFDAHMLLKDGINIRDNIYFDTMIAQAVLNENDELGLKAIATKYGKFFGFEDKSIDFGTLFGKNPQNFIKADMRLATYYASKDTHLVLRLMYWQLEMMNKQPKLYYVYFNMEQKITPICIDMEDTGFSIDFDYSEEYKVELAEQVKYLEKKLMKLWGDVNLNSPKQLQTLFYDQMRLKDISGKRSVDAKTLKQLARDNEEISILLEYRELNKLLSTYVEPLPQKVRNDTKRLCGVFNQIGTATGRFSSKEPNLQNLPMRARHLIKASEGKVIIGIDFSSIEPRVASHIANDSIMKQAYWDKVDLYASLASNVFKLPIEYCLDGCYAPPEYGIKLQPRKMAKTALLAILYGTSPFTLADQLGGIPVYEAEKLIEDFFKAYPELAEFVENTHKSVDERGYVETLHGRKRRFIGHIEVAKQYHAVERRIIHLLGEVPKNIWASELPRDLKRAYWKIAKEYSRVKRQSVNAIIQGTAAEIMKIAMISIYEYFRQRNDELGYEAYKMLATIHDEVLLEVPKDIKKEEVEHIESLMMNAVKLDVPVEVDTEFMMTWGKGKNKEKWYQEVA
ncbi:DNA polymerase [Bacillus altitudinis]|uniref:DNA polymerase n=1 Tax=Bacillus altitudinis TaxID=293387 RepID=UPI00389B16F9